MIRRFTFALLISSCLTMPSHAIERVDFVGQFGRKALLDIDGRQRIVAVGETTPEGVRLVALDGKTARIEYAGAAHSLDFSQRIQSVYKAPTTAEARIAADSGGSFRTAGTINGRVVELLVDTGASGVAMNESAAARLGVDYRYEGRPVRVTTASGLAPAYSVKLKSVRVGEIELTNVDGLVIEGAFPVEILLGMSFLNGVEITRTDGVLVLKKHH